MNPLNRMILWLPSLVLLTAATICHGQLSAGPQEPSKTQTVTGQVVNSLSGEPIARARVQVGGRQAVLTDHERDEEAEHRERASGQQPLQLLASVTAHTFYIRDGKVSRKNARHSRLVPQEKQGSRR